ncbi:MAG: CpsB/CapC family capsule biosynthesis tyrosine phosphatase [Candidatus Hydrogenedentota bacterium]
MIDIHSHILPNLDDGPDDFETSLEMMRIAEQDGITDIIATPHLLTNSVDKEKVKLIHSNVSLLNEIAENEKINVKLHPASENMASEDMTKHLLQKKTILPLNKNNRYLLIEFSLYNIPDWAELLIFQCLIDGIIPVLSHPERIKTVIEDPSIIYDLVIKGVLCQMDAPSITGVFGKDIQKLAFKLLQCRLIHFIGTDSHNTTTRKPVLSQARDKAAEIVGEKMAEILVYDNPKSVLEGSDIKGFVPKNPANFFSLYFSKTL